VFFQHWDAIIKAKIGINHSVTLIMKTFSTEKGWIAPGFNPVSRNVEQKAWPINDYFIRSVPFHRPKSEIRFRILIIVIITEWLLYFLLCNHSVTLIKKTFSTEMGWIAPGFKPVKNEYCEKNMADHWLFHKICTLSSAKTGHQIQCYDKECTCRMVTYWFWMASKRIFLKTFFAQNSLFKSAAILLIFRRKTDANASSYSLKVMWHLNYFWKTG